MTDEDLVVDSEGRVESEDDVHQPDDISAEGDVSVEEGGEKPEPSDEEKEMTKLKEAISVKMEEIGPLRLKLTVTVPQETLDERRGDQFAELKRDAVVPGFRKGHAPLVLVEKRFGSDVGEQLKGQLLGGGYLAAVEKEDLKPLGDPRFWVKVTDERVDEEQRPRKVEVEKLVTMTEALDHIKLPKEGPLVFSCELELKPTFELPALEKIPVRRPAVAIDDDDVESELRRMRMMRGTFQPVEEGPIEPNDLLYADVKMSVDGESMASADNLDIPARDTQVKGIPLTGFGDAVTGKRAGDQVTFEATVPDDHENMALRGKTACFTFIIHEVKRLVVPPMDAAFLSAIGFDSEDDLHREIRTMLESRLDEILRRTMREQVGKHLVDHTVLDIPEGLSQRQTERSVARRLIEMQQAGLPLAELEKAKDDLRARAHDQVVRDLKLFFILEKIAEERKIDVAEDRMNAAIAQIARQSGRRFDRVRDDLGKGDGLLNLYLQLRDQQVLDSLLDDAEITETEGPKTAEPGAAEGAEQPA